MKTHKDLDVWKGSMTMVKEVYKLTSAFPKTEMHGLTDQIRRVAVSVPANISKGSARNNTREFNHFLRKSLGRLAKLETLLMIAIDLENLSPEDCKPLFEKTNMIIVQLSNLMKVLEIKIQFNDQIQQ